MLSQKNIEWKIVYKGFSSTVWTPTAQNSAATSVGGRAESSSQASLTCRAGDKQPQPRLRVKISTWRWPLGVLGRPYTLSFFWHHRWWSLLLPQRPAFPESSVSFRPLTRFGCSCGRFPKALFSPNIFYQYPHYGFLSDCRIALWPLTKPSILLEFGQIGVYPLRPHVLSMLVSEEV